jgi:hypothetical protein
MSSSAILAVDTWKGLFLQKVDDDPSVWVVAAVLMGMLPVLSPTARRLFGRFVASVARWCVGHCPSYPRLWDPDALNKPDDGSNAEA